MTYQSDRQRRRLSRRRRRCVTSASVNRCGHSILIMTTTTMTKTNQPGTDDSTSANRSITVRTTVTTSWNVINESIAGLPSIGALVLGVPRRVRITAVAVRVADLPVRPVNDQLAL